MYFIRNRQRPIRDHVTIQISIWVNTMYWDSWGRWCPKRFFFHTRRYSFYIFTPPKHKIRLKITSESFKFIKKGVRPEQVNDTYRFHKILLTNSRRWWSHFFDSYLKRLIGQTQNSLDGVRVSHLCIFHPEYGFARAIHSAIQSQSLVLKIKPHFSFLKESFEQW